MPYSRIVWIKLKIELMSDYRFTDTLSDLEKLIFISLLLLAGDTNNTIPNDELYIKRRLNLNASDKEIRAAIDHIIQVFPKTIVNNGVISFSNFEEYHNLIGGSSKGVPKEFQRSSKGRAREDKEEDKDKDKDEEKEALSSDGRKITREITPELQRKERAKKKEDAKTPDIEAVKKYFYRAYRHKLRTYYGSMKPDKEQSALKQLLESGYSVQDLQILIDKFFVSEDEFITTSAYTISVFKAVIRQLIKPVSKKERPLDESDAIHKARMAEVEKKRKAKLEGDK